MDEPVTEDELAMEDLVTPEHPAPDDLEEDVTTQLETTEALLVTESINKRGEEDCYREIINDDNSTTTIAETGCQSQCIDKDIFYVSMGIGSVFCLLFFLLLLSTFLYYRKYIRYHDPKKVSRAESWRYESNIYINPGRQKPAVPVYVAPPVLPPLTNRVEQVEVIQEVDTPRYNTLDRWSAEGSTRAASPQTSPLLNSRRESNIVAYSPSTINSRNGQRSRSGTPGATPQQTPPSSPLQGRRASRGHNRQSSLSSALRGVDIIRCATPGYPPPSPPVTGRRLRQSSLESSATREDV